MGGGASALSPTSFVLMSKELKEIYDTMIDEGHDDDEIRLKLMSKYSSHFIANAEKNAAATDAIINDTKGLSIHDGTAANSNHNEISLQSDSVLTDDNFNFDFNSNNNKIKSTSADNNHSNNNSNYMSNNNSSSNDNQHNFNEKENNSNNSEIINQPQGLSIKAKKARKRRGTFENDTVVTSSSHPPIPIPYDDTTADISTDITTDTNTDVDVDVSVTDAAVVIVSALEV